MCLAVPTLLISVDGDSGEVEIGGVRRRIGLQLTPEARAGDYVLVHTGFSINVLDPDEAEASLKLFAELEAMDEQDDTGPKP